MAKSEKERLQEAENLLEDRKRKFALREEIKRSKAYTQELNNKLKNKKEKK